MIKPLLVAALALTAAPALSGTATGPEARRCLADVVYAEARGESRTGQIAVAEVVMNRVAKRGFPGTVCGVARQSGQFSRPVPVREPGAYARAQEIAEVVIAGEAAPVTNGALYFHTTAVRPDWSGRFRRTARIGDHVFYGR